ncbi:MAG TPA: DEAD/DEAH box helicase [Saprospiraceae bacterium]|nr:DEAD/DEAH box helicase [Saprospiraceae bacterium]HMP13798.1 DEAD/DEAH box helicase [Saprospiraceae bacterium]
MKTTFEELGLIPEVLTAIGELGFEHPTPIQEQSIPYILQSRNDLIALAQTGTGKTGAFGLPVLQQINRDNNATQMLILCPTRELCLQISKELTLFAKYLRALRIVPVYGGADIVKQMQELRRGAQIVVGTPGRVIDLINRRKLELENIQWLVLDEADEMLSMGFKEELDTILAQTSADKQTLLFSATMPREMMVIAEKYMRSPQEISVGKKNVGAENVQHQYFMIHAKDRYEALKRIADYYPSIYGIVFCRTRQETKDIADKLMQDGYNADALHGDLSQAQRDYVMNRFRAKQLQILVATDVAARGLDVNNLTHVINYNLPDDPEVYVHRSGRTGRAGKSGISISLIHLREKSRLHFIEKTVGKKFEQKPVPTGQEVCEKQLFKLVDAVEKVEVDESQIEQYLPVIYKKLAWLDREQLIKHFVSVEFNHFLAYYKNAPDLNVALEPRRERKASPERDSKRFGNGKFSRISLNLGKKDQITPRSIIDLINKHTPGKSVRIGQIELSKTTATIEIDRKYQQEVLRAFQNARYKGKKLIAEEV